jgi:hypothetical protein
MARLDFLLLREVDVVEGVVLEANLPFPPPPLQFLLCVVYDIVFVFRGLEDMVILKSPEGALVRQAKVRSEV